MLTIFRFALHVIILFDFKKILKKDLICSIDKTRLFFQYTNHFMDCIELLIPFLQLKKL